MAQLVPLAQVVSLEQPVLLVQLGSMDFLQQMVQLELHGPSGPTGFPGPAGANSLDGATAATGALEPAGTCAHCELRNILGIISLKYYLIHSACINEINE